MRALAVTVLLILPGLAAALDSPDDAYFYTLTPEQVAPDTWVFFGSTDHFSMRNGGNIVNTAFIVTDVGIVVIDTGPSLKYGKAMREAIGRVSSSPIVTVFNTHNHPDHFLGNQAFSDVPIVALQGTIDGIKNQGEAFVENLYRLLGPWMKGTELYLPTQAVEPGDFEIGNRRLSLFGLRGHSGADLAILDASTGVLFAGDLCFHDRAPTTPTAVPGQWRDSLAQLASVDYKLMVPGHGPLADDDAPIEETRAYLAWLEQNIESQVRSGRAMAEALGEEIPERFQTMATLREEYARSVMHLFPGVEKHFFEHAEAEGSESIYAE